MGFLKLPSDLDGETMIQVGWLRGCSLAVRICSCGKDLQHAVVPMATPLGNGAFGVTLWGRVSSKAGSSATSTSSSLQAVGREAAPQHRSTAPWGCAILSSKQRKADKNQFLS